MPDNTDMGWNAEGEKGQEGRMKPRQMWRVVGIVLVVSVLIFVLVGVKQARDTARRAAENFWREEAARVLESSAAEDTSGGPEAWLPDAGRLPEATLRAYFYYKDRGLFSKLRGIVVEESLGSIPAEDGAGMLASAQEARGLIVDHAEVAENEATLYFRSWFSSATRLHGGRPYIGRLIKQDGSWKVDVRATLQLTMANAKGKNKLGFYNGTKEWWK